MGSANCGNRGIMPTEHQEQCPGRACRRVLHLGAWGRAWGRRSPASHRAWASSPCFGWEVRREVCLGPNARGSIILCPPLTATSPQRDLQELSGNPLTRRELEPRAQMTYRWVTKPHWSQFPYWWNRARVKRIRHDYKNDQFFSQMYLVPF